MLIKQLERWMPIQRSNWWLKFLKRVGEEEIKANWFEVLAGIPGISNREVKRVHIEGKYDILKLLEVSGS